MCVHMLQLASSFKILCAFPSGAGFFFHTDLGHPAVCTHAGVALPGPSGTAGGIAVCIAETEAL